MRKELLGILLFFIIIFSLFSLLSYHPEDPSVVNHKAVKEIHNLFGLLGAHISGILVFLFGISSLWIPVILSFISYYIFIRRPGNEMILPGIGALILIVSTGSILAISGDFYHIFGNKIASGGVVGTGLKTFIVRYFNTAGGTIILLLIWIIGFILGAETSLSALGRRLWTFVLGISHKFQQLYLICKNFSKQKASDAKTLSQIHVKPLKNVVKKIQKMEIRAIPHYPSQKPEIKPKAKSNKLVSPKKKTAAIIEKKNVPVSDKNIKSKEVIGKKTGNIEKNNNNKLKKKKFQMPVITFMNEPEKQYTAEDREYLEHQAEVLTGKLEDFNVKGKVTKVIPGPVITTFEYKPAPGVKINKVVNLTDDLALALRAISIRIVAPIPGRAVIGIEVPNLKREIVWLKEIINSQTFKQSQSKLTICLGKDIVGNPVVAHLDQMPHLLIAGATGTGKSVGLNSMICSLLYKSEPDDVKLIMVDPKRIELSMYDGIPHLITPVVTDVKKATNALFWAVSEMERRYELLSEKKVRNIVQYNKKIQTELTIEHEARTHNKLPYIVIIIDELADLMVAASRDVEVSLMRLAQMARAAGIHLIIATQRPSVDVLTGIIKANFPTRLTFQVSSKIDSRTIIDTNGAQSLLGSGDMLFLPPGTARLQRIHGAYISEDELQKITTFLKSQSVPEYDETVIEAPSKVKEKSDDEEYDERYDDAVALVTKTRQASISMVQRHLRIGFNRAARIIEVMEKEGIVGPADGTKPREILVPGYDD